jgi:hypothetical protein
MINYIICTDRNVMRKLLAMYNVIYANFLKGGEKRKKRKCTLNTRL